MLREWNDLPEYMRTEEVLPYYNKLKKKRFSFTLKRFFDFIVSLIMIVALMPIMIIISVLIVKDSNGGIFFKQERITQYGRKFKILKFRTMVSNAESLGTQVTVENDKRITKIGSKLRKCRLDELPQLINIMLGDMSFVGTRPEATKYVRRYTSEMMATLLLPAGVTSEASIKYKDEDELLANSENADETYVEEILPEKMKYNLDSIKKYSCIRDFVTMVKTVVAVLR